MKNMNINSYYQVRHLFVKSKNEDHTNSNNNNKSTNTTVYVKFSFLNHLYA